LESRVLSTPEFKEWSDKVVLFLHNTSQVNGEPYPALLREKGGNGFPTVSYLDAEGNLLKQVGHVTPVEELDAALQQLGQWQALRDRAADGDAAVTRQLFLMELDMKILDPVAARATADELFKGDERAQLEGELVNLEFLDLLQKTPRDQIAMGGKRFLDMYRLGRIPTARQETSFWQYMFEYAKAEGDADLFEELLGDLKERKAGDRRLERYLQGLEKDLAALKGGN